MTELTDEYTADYVAAPNADLMNIHRNVLPTKHATHMLLAYSTPSCT